MGKWEENKWVWNFKWRQQWFQWELTLMENLIDVVGGVNVMGENDDEWACVRKSQGYIYC